MSKKASNNLDNEPVSCTLQESADFKAKILERALVHVGTHGWTKATLERAARDLEQPPEMVWALFPEGCRNAIACWSRQVDQHMMERLSLLPMADMKVRERIFWAIRTRLEILAPFKSAVSETLKFFLNPRYACDGFRLTSETVHQMWVAAGDASTDYNYYTKRMLLSGVYSATLLYWLRDHSIQHANTWGFLEHRIQEVLRLGKLPHELKVQTAKAKHFAKAFLQALRRP